MILSALWVIDYIVVYILSPGLLLLVLICGLHRSSNWHYLKVAKREKNSPQDLFSNFAHVVAMRTHNNLASIIEIPDFRQGESEVPFCKCTFFHFTSWKNIIKTSLGPHVYRTSQGLSFGANFVPIGYQIRNWRLFKHWILIIVNYHFVFPLKLPKAWIWSMKQWILLYNPPEFHFNLHAPLLLFICRLHIPDLVETGMWYLSAKALGKFDDSML